MPHQRFECGGVGHQKYSPNFFKNGAYGWYLNRALIVSVVKYVVLLVYFLRAMQVQLCLPLYCESRHGKFPCMTSNCFWIQHITVVVPTGLFDRQTSSVVCAATLLFSVLSVLLFICALYTVCCEVEGIWRNIYVKLLLVVPSVAFEFGLSLVFFYPIILAFVQQLHALGNVFSVLGSFVYMLSLTLASAFLVGLVTIAILNLLVFHIAAHFLTIIYIIDPKNAKGANNTYSEFSYSAARLLEPVSTPRYLNPAEHVQILSVSAAEKSKGALNHAVSDEAYSRLRGAMIRGGSASSEASAGVISNAAAKPSNNKTAMSGSQRVASAGDVLSASRRTSLRLQMNASSTSDYTQLPQMYVDDAAASTTLYQHARTGEVLCLPLVRPRNSYGDSSEEGYLELR